MVDDGKDIPRVRQCQLLQISRSSVYYRSVRDEESHTFECRVLNAIDELYTEGVPKDSGTLGGRTKLLLPVGRPQAAVLDRRQGH